MNITIIHIFLVDDQNESVSKKLNLKFLHSLNYEEIHEAFQNYILELYDTDDDQEGPDPEAFCKFVKMYAPRSLCEYLPEINR